MRDGGPSSATYSGARSSGYPPFEKVEKKPPTLRAAVKACDVEGVSQALKNLQGNAEAALDATDGMGRTVLHICAANSRREGTGDVVALLLQQKAGRG